MKRVKKRVIFVTLFIIAFAIYSYINVRGEYLQILGIGSKYVEIFKHNLMQRIYVFLISALVSGILEYTIGYTLYHISGTRLWNYNTEILNFGNINGFVCLRSVLFFGIAGLFLMYLVIPCIERLALNISKKKFSIISIGSFSMFYADTIYNHIISKIINYLK